MSGLALILALGGVLPLPFEALSLDSGSLDSGAHAARASVEAGALLLDLEFKAPGSFDELGRTLENGLSVGDLHIGVDGTPGNPFLSNFFSANEIRFTEIDFETVVSHVMVRVQVTLD